MKIYLSCIGFILSFNVCFFVSSEHVDGHRDILNSVNRLRKKYADVANIPKMKDLKYDLNLEKIAVNYPDCEKSVNLKNQSTYFPSESKLIDEFFEVFDETETQNIIQTFGFESVLNPIFTHIGCIRFEKSCTSTVKYVTEYFTKMQVVNTTGICFLNRGPFCLNGTVEMGKCKAIPVETKSEKSESRVPEVIWTILLIVVVFVK